jgi:hypothetical protein
VRALMRLRPLSIRDKLLAMVLLPLAGVLPLLGLLPHSAPICARRDS